MNNDNNSNRGCPNFGELLQNWQLRRELDRERKRRETEEIYGTLNLFLGLFVGAFSVGLIMFLIMRSGMDRETAETFARLFVSLAVLFIVFVILVLVINTIMGRIIRWHNERKKQKSDSKKEDGQNV